jgi:hypothetical protein
MNDSPSMCSLAVSESAVAGAYGDPGLFEFFVVDGEGLVSCYFSPTHSPNPSLAPPGERGELHLAACLKAGTLRSTARWPQSEGNPATGRHSQIRPRISSPALDFSGSRPQGTHADQALPQRQLASTCLQPIERRLNQLPTQFDGNAPLRTFFPPLNTRPNVAVSSLSAPAGVERVGVRGGIQRIRNKNAADNRFGSSTAQPHRAQKELQKQEQTMHIARGLEVKKTQIISHDPKFVIKELTA